MTQALPRPHITMILARADNGVIGRDGDLPWHLPEDLKRFKRLTMGEHGQGRPMVMGRKTFESLPGLLPKRRHIVLTRDLGWRAKGAEIAATIDQVMQMVGDAQNIAIIGGAQIYALFEPLAHRIEMTQVHEDTQGDTRVAAFDPAIWQEVRRDSHAASEGRPAYSFVTLERGLDAVRQD